MSAAPSGSSAVTAGPFLPLNTSAEGPRQRIKAAARRRRGGRKGDFRELMEPGSAVRCEVVRKLHHESRGLRALGVSLAVMRSRQTGRIHARLALSCQGLNATSQFSRDDKLKTHSDQFGFRTSFSFNVLSHTCKKERLKNDLD